MNRVQENLQSVPLITQCILIINVTVHILIFLFSFPVSEICMNPFFIIYKYEYFRIITNVFVHGGIMHIVMNMMSLVQLGTLIEKDFGSIKFLFLTIWTILLAGTLFITLTW
jgi:membrane associated rhomboid family serine protease